MPRKRMIDPQIWDSEQVMSLTSDMFKMYIYLISQADDEGRLKIASRLWGKRVFPFCNIKPEEIRKTLQGLHNIGLIVIYNVNGDEYLYHPNWHKYQKISHPAPSNLPFPCNSVKTPEDSGVLRSVPPQFSLVSIDKFSIDKVNGSAAPSPPPNSFEKSIKDFIVTVIDDYNKVTKQNRNPESKDIQQLLKARYKDGFTELKDYKLVHRYIWSTWHGGRWTNKDTGNPSDFYIRPKTIYSAGKVLGYGSGFAEYLEQARQWQNQYKEKHKTCSKCGKDLVNEIKNGADSCYSCGTVFEERVEKRIEGESQPQPSNIDVPWEKS